MLKRIVGHPDYWVSDDGKIYSSKRGWNKKEKKQKVGAGGYKQVTLYKDSKPHHCLVHRLVLMAFRGFPPSGGECRHLDGDPANNNLDNLRWGTIYDNRADMRKHGTAPVGEKNFNSKLNKLQVRIIRSLYGDLYQKYLASVFCVHPLTINSIMRRKTWRHI